MGWKGVGVAEALGAEVTKMNGRAGCVETGAGFAHPTSNRLAMSITRNDFLMDYSLGVRVNGTSEAVKVGTTVVGTGVNVCVGNAVASEVGSDVAVAMVGMIVTPGTGVRVEMSGTQRSCPA